MRLAFAEAERTITGGTEPDGAEPGSVKTGPTFLPSPPSS
jgi:hypothetical protein